MANVLVPEVRKPADQACVWMRAGLLGYKLCDRGFDCEHCPLDAALRGETPGYRAPSDPDRCVLHPVRFPADRLYAPGHTWVAAVGDAPRHVRLGLDAFAASLLGPPRGLRRTSLLRELAPGERLCELVLEEGTVPITSPVAARVCAWNDALGDSLGPITEAPYEGWIAELEPGSALGELVTGPEALHAARLDAGHFCRAAAIHLLAEPNRWTDLPAERLCRITDLRRLLGREAFLALVRDLIH